MVCLRKPSKKELGRRTRDRLTPELAARVRRGLVEQIERRGHSIYDLRREFDALSLPELSDRYIRRAFSPALTLSAQTALGLIVRARRLGVTFPNRDFSDDALLEILTIARPQYDKEPVMLLFPSETAALVNLCVSIAQEFAGRGAQLKTRMEKRFEEAFAPYERLNRDPYVAQLVYLIKSRLPKPWRHHFLEKRFARYSAAAPTRYTIDSPIAVLEREYMRLVAETNARRNDEEP